MADGFTLDPFDDAVLQTLRAGITAHGSDALVHEDLAPADYQAKVITADLPYLVYRSGDSITEGPRRLAGGAALEKTFELMHVGETREQARALGDLAKLLVHERHLDALLFPSGSWIRRTQRSGIRHERTYTGKGGVQLLYGIDEYTFVP